MLTITQVVSPIEILLKTLTIHYLSNSYCFTIVSEIQYDFNFPLSFINIDASGNNKYDLEDRLLEAADHGCLDYVVRMKNPRRFMTAFEGANRRGIVRRSDKRIIFVPFPDANYTDRVFKMLTMKECSAVANILAIIPDVASKCESFTFVTHKFVGTDSEIDQPLVLGHWNSCTQQIVENINLFPHDMTDMKGKKITVSGLTCKPYVVLDLDATVVPNGRDGVEIRILDEMCKQINCSIAIKREDKDLWGRLDDHTGIIGNVAKNRVEMGIAGLYAWHEGWLEMDISSPYLNIAVTCLVPAPRILWNWQVPLWPFSILMWLAVLMTFIFGAVALYIVRKGSCDKAMLIVFGTMISQPPYNATNTWRNRSVVGWLLVTGVILVSAYGAGLASTFTLPKYEASIDTTQDLVDRDMKWGGNHESWIYSILLSPEPLMKKIAKQFIVYPAEELKKRTLKRSMAFGIEKLSSGRLQFNGLVNAKEEQQIERHPDLHKLMYILNNLSKNLVCILNMSLIIGTYSIPTFITKEAANDMQILLEDFFYEQCVILMSKNSPYSQKLNHLIGILHQSGLLIAWVHEVTLKYMDYQVQLAAKISRVKGEVLKSALSMRQMQGVFIIYLIGVNAAFVLFLGENCFFYYKHGTWFH